MKHSKFCFKYLNLKQSIHPCNKNLFDNIKVFKIWIYFIFRHNEKVTLECELAELRRQRNSEWEKTKHHLKLAKSKISLLNIQESFDKETINGNNHRDRDNLSNHNSKDIDSPLEEGGRQGSYVWLELDILSL